MTDPTPTGVNGTRLCIQSGRPATNCHLDHDGVGCTTGLYRLDPKSITGPVDLATRRTIEASPEITRDLTRGAYTDELVRFVLHEAVRTGAVTLISRGAHHGR